MEKWAEHRATDCADDNVVYWGSQVIWFSAVCDESTGSKFLAAGAEKVLGSIIGPSGETTESTIWAASALKKLRPELPS